LDWAFLFFLLVPGSSCFLAFGPGADTILFEPLGKRMIIFKGDTIEHKVLLTQISWKGWLLHQSEAI